LNESDSGLCIFGGVKRFGSTNREMFCTFRDDFSSNSCIVV